MMDPKEKTIVIIKPDGVTRGIIGDVIHRFERKGLKIVAMKFLRFPDELIEEHYAHHLDKPFFPKLREFMTSSPALAIALEGKDVTNVVRMMTGPTHGVEALPGTIRGDFALSIQHNVVHASENAEEAKKELERFFAPEEIFDDYNRADWGMIYAVDER